MTVRDEHDAEDEEEDADEDDEDWLAEEEAEEPWVEDAWVDLSDGSFVFWSLVSGVLGSSGVYGGGGFLSPGGSLPPWPPPPVQNGQMQGGEMPGKGGIGGRPGGPQ